MRGHLCLAAIYQRLCVCPTIGGSEIAAAIGPAMISWVFPINVPSTHASSVTILGTSLTNSDVFPVDPTPETYLGGQSTRCVPRCGLPRGRVTPSIAAHDFPKLRLDLCAWAWARLLVCACVRACLCVRVCAHASVRLRSLVVFVCARSRLAFSRVIYGCWQDDRVDIGDLAALPAKWRWVSATTPLGDVDHSGHYGSHKCHHKHGLDRFHVRWSVGYLLVLSRAGGGTCTPPALL